jgi:hypothetical protein
MVRVKVPTMLEILIFFAILVLALFAVGWLLTAE